ncbi:MAG TPA: APC family permease [Pseudonocardia sp.]|nr:APC family permease [Pseudonocardia sp.]
MSASLGTAATEDLKFRRTLGFWSLVAAGLGSVIGSGWLFASMYAAQDAGPASLIAWVIGGVLMLAVALVFAELGISRPESGGLVRYPLYSNGRLVAGIVGWCFWISYLANPPTEAAGVVQYASSYLPGVYSGHRLTGLGVLLAIGLMAVFVLVNYFGVKIFARTNNIITAVKILIPTATVILLIASGFDGRNFTRAGGFAPYGYSAALGTIATAGIVFAYTGFRNIVELSGEVINPRRHIPAALVTTILVTIALYLGLEFAYLGGVPAELLGGGWHGVNLDSPYAQLAMVLGMPYLYWTLIADSMISPSGSGIVYTAANARNAYGLAKNGFFPAWVCQVNDRWGVPRRALLVNFVVGVAFLLPLPSWHAITAAMGSLAVFTFSIGSISLMAFRRAGVTGPGDRLGGMAVLAPAVFVISALVIVWVPWPKLLESAPVVAIGLIWYLVTVARRPGTSRALTQDEVRAGLWIVVHLVFLYAVSALGSFQGLGVIPAPWDSVLVAVVSLAIYVWGVSAGVAYLAAHPAPAPVTADDGLA